MLAASSAGATGDVNVGRCPVNESLSGFEAYLADCRGYELVTPPFKAGDAPSLSAIAADGLEMLTESVSVTGGVEGDGLRAYYASTRSSSGWETSAINPPSSSFPAQELFAASRDLGESLWRTRHGSESIFSQDLYLREPSGEFVEVGPMVPSNLAEGEAANGYKAFAGELVFGAGASPGLSQVFFQPKGNGLLWPGDTTQHRAAARSLYAYEGTNNLIPTLVGIDSEGSLLSSCGTALGSIATGAYNEDVYNAVSADGSIVFFTAVGHDETTECEEAVPAPEATELFARIGRFPIDTVSLSEPPESACEACQTGVATFKHPRVEERPAEFQGASEDGSKAFFLTSQELFEGDTGQNLFEYDFDNPAGHKVLRVSVGLAKPKVLGVARVSEDGSHVYFVAQGELTTEPRQGASGRCVAGLTPSERSEEEAAELEEMEKLAKEQEGEAEKAKKCHAKRGAANLYVFERDVTHPGGHVAFIATLSGADANDWRSEDNRPVQATPDGRFLVFSSLADLTAGDTSGVGQVFEYDAASEELVRVSKGATEYPAGDASANEHASTITKQKFAQFLEPGTTGTRLAVSSDGSTVVFQSKAALTPGAVSAAESKAETVYEYRSSGSVMNGAVFQVSDGENQLSAVALGIDASGSDIFFRTPDALVPGDVDSQLDSYDARVDGGFPPPREPSDCLLAASCQGGANVPPVFRVAGSADVVGGGNAPPGPVPLPPSPPRPTRVQLLAKALRRCHGERSHHRRIACETRARKKYGTKTKRKGKG